MNERQSENMIPLKREIYKITMAHMFILLICIIAIRHEGIQVATDIIHKSFAAKAESNDGDSVKFSMSLLETFSGKTDHELDMLFGEDEGDMNPYADEFEKSGLYGNETKSWEGVDETVKKIEKKSNYAKELYGLRHQARKHRWNRPEWDTKDMTEEETIVFAKMIMSWVSVAIYVYGMVGLMIF